jgi:cysteine-rich repeat protein
MVKKYKKLPRYLWGHSGNVSKPFVITLITVVVLLVLSLFLLFEDQLVGKAFAPGQANIGLVDVTATVGNTFQVPVMVNLGADIQTVALEFTVTLPNELSCNNLLTVPVTSSLPWSANLLINEISCDNNNNNVVTFRMATYNPREAVPAATADDDFTIAVLEFRDNVPVDTYTLTLSSARIIDLNTHTDLGLTRNNGDVQIFASCVDGDNDGFDTCDVGVSGGDNFATDCDDADANTNPGVTENGALCDDGLDHNCNGLIDCNDPNCNSESCMLAGGATGQCNFAARECRMVGGTGTIGTPCTSISDCVSGLVCRDSDNDGDLECSTGNVCGDGVTDDLTETCDDGNTNDGDYCSADCQTVTGRCGDGTIQSNEVCDGVNGCSTDCQTLNSCTDTDNGVDYNVAGSITVTSTNLGGSGGGAGYPDRCALGSEIIADYVSQGATPPSLTPTQEYLVEFSCSANNDLDVDFEICANGCSNGACTASSSSVNSCVSSQNQLVSLWQGENNANDAQGNNGGTVNGPTFNTGRLGQAFNFDGVDDHVVITDPADGSLDFGTGDFTLEAWFNIPTYQNAWSSIISKGASGSDGYGIEISSTNRISCSIDAVGGYNQHVLGSQPTLNQWHHVVCVFDRDGNVIIYLDGVAVSTIGSASLTRNSGSISNSRNLYLGRYAVPYPHFQFRGMIDEVAVYNRILTQTEVAANYGLCTATGNDADNDGVTDSNDLCSSTPAASTNVNVQGCVLGDINVDGIVNIVDLQAARFFLSENYANLASLNILDGSNNLLPGPASGANINSCMGSNSESGIDDLQMLRFALAGSTSLLPTNVAVSTSTFSVTFNPTTESFSCIQT